MSSACRLGCATEDVRDRSTRPPEAVAKDQAKAIEPLGFARTAFLLHAIQTVTYKNEENAKAALSAIQSSQQFIRLSFVVEETCDEEWLLRVDGKLSVPINEVHLTMEDVALRFAGRYDGFERPLSAE